MLRLSYSFCKISQRITFSVLPAFRFTLLVTPRKCSEPIQKEEWHTRVYGNFLQTVMHVTAVSPRVKQESVGCKSEEIQRKQKRLVTSCQILSLPLPKKCILNTLKSHRNRKEELYKTQSGSIAI